MEQWRPVVGYEGWYEVSDQGRVRRMKATRGARVGRLLTARETTGRQRGYRTVRLTRDYVSTSAMVHTLVLEAFVAPRPPGHEPDHRDFDRSNNRASNLRWLPRRLNRTRIRRERLPWGEGAAQARLSAADVTEIRATSGETLRALAARYEVSHSHILAIKQGRAWRRLPWSEGARWGQGGRRRGERHPAARLTADAVRKIRRRYAAGGATHRALAQEYGVAEVTIAAIVTRRNWAWLDEA